MRTHLTNLFALAFLVVGCQGYDVSVNDRVVYTPKPLLQDYQVADRHLDTCIAQTVKDEKVTSLAELKRLRCTHAGIESLAGLERFYALEELDLSDNHIEDIRPVGRLGKLTILHLENNRIVKTAPLLNLLRLTDVNLAGNPNAQCKDLQQLKENVGDNQGSTVLPQPCR